MILSCNLKEKALELEKLYSDMVKEGIPKEDARYILPNATVSEIVVSANFRELRHIFEVRCHQRAHWEIREVCLEMLKIMKQKAPIVFWDFEIDEKNKTAIRKKAEEEKGDV